MSSIIGYDTYLTATSVSVGSKETAATGHTGANAADWRLHTYYTPTGGTNATITVDPTGTITPDYAAVVIDNVIGNSTVITVYGGATSSSLATLGSASGLTENRPIFVDISGATGYGYYEVKVAQSVKPVVRHVALGQRLTLPKLPGRDFIPPPYAIEDEVTNNRSESGAFVGRSIKRRGHRLNLDLHPVTPAWVRANWEDFSDHARCKPFYFFWSPSTYPQETAFCWTDVSQPNASYISECWMRAGVNAKALVELTSGCT